MRKDSLCAVRRFIRYLPNYSSMNRGPNVFALNMNSYHINLTGIDKECKVQLIKIRLNSSSDLAKSVKISLERY